MPAVSTGPKELYLSSSLGELNKKAEVKPEKITNTKSYVHSACKLFKAAEESRLDRDEEKAYVFYMKYLTIYDVIKKRPDFKQQQDFYMKLLGPNSIKKAIEEAEKLSENLKLRYEEVEVRRKLEEKERLEEKKRKEEITEKENSRLSPKTTSKKDNKKVKDGHNEIKNATPKAPTPAGGITAEKLMAMMKDQTITLIVMDARPFKDFEDSHIQVPVQTCISVPDEAVSPGITVNQIEAKLPEASKDQQATTPPLILSSTLSHRPTNPSLPNYHPPTFGCKGKSQVKLRTNVDFSTDSLDLSPFLSSSAFSSNYSSYKLYAVVNHIGHLNMGHYTALCYNTVTQTWFCFDDSEVRPVEGVLLQSPHAYILFYSRQSFLKPQIPGL
uniref:ubiquitinyl hydrolase 1 n=1 Tax=Knipowitschia caucasica TaxID=637954 RepID=A0AAV2LMK5_KNICA